MVRTSACLRAAASLDASSLLNDNLEYGMLLDVSSSVTLKYVGGHLREGRKICERRANKMMRKSKFWKYVYGLGKQRFEASASTAGM